MNLGRTNNPRRRRKASSGGTPPQGPDAFALDIKLRAPTGTNKIAIAAFVALVALALILTHCGSATKAGAMLSVWLQ